MQSPDTKRRKAREQMARYRARQSTEAKEEARRKTALQQKACKDELVTWSVGRKAKERRSNTRNTRIRRQRLMNLMIEDEPAAYGSRQAEGKAMKRVFVFPRVILSYT